MHPARNCAPNSEKLYTTPVPEDQSFKVIRPAREYTTEGYSWCLALGAGCVESGNTSTSVELENVGSDFQRDAFHPACWAWCLVLGAGCDGSGYRGFEALSALDESGSAVYERYQDLPHGLPQSPSCITMRRQIDDGLTSNRQWTNAVWVSSVLIRGTIPGSAARSASVTVREYH